MGSLGGHQPAMHSRRPTTPIPTDFTYLCYVVHDECERPNSGAQENGMPCRKAVLDTCTPPLPVSASLRK
jgi:hypothetical protein